MADKCKKLKRQVSNDGGMTWQDMIPYEYIAGELIQKDSPDCNNIEWRTVSGYICEENTTEMIQWVADTGYVCVGFNKMNKEKEQVSYNSGISWADTGNTRAGSTLIEQNSTDCGYVPTPSIRWVADTGYVCVGYDKYNKEKEQQSTDGGTTWTDTGNTRAGSTLIEANSTDCGYSPHDYSREYLTTEALGRGKISLENVSAPYDREPITNIQYSKNNGAWTSYTYDTKISVVTGDKIRWKATIKDGNSSKWNSNFDATADYKVYGNPLSLLDNDGFVNNPDALHENAYYSLFWHNSTLKDASGLALPATTLTRQCYTLMFDGCSSLTAAPKLPATRLATECYSWMFSDCTSLTTAPELPATSLSGEWCYRNMFEGCKSLTNAPELPATTLTYGCYSQMFEGCSSLTNAPVLPATVLTGYCYSYMFRGCTNLNNVTCCATDISASNCTNTWLLSVSSTGTFTKATGVTWSSGSSGIPSGWTIVDAT